ncbi:uncharacterized protein LOC123509856 [Portunus trituberculatus]|uniref:uncharacterized protein LOC123509856 n=1 Tax=Portunus trituberculatus TaxID=210409 RepID=UPI001E1CE04C|nr:uncharacterized protein LOC123509856 [Portunus trituberculatus]XP_045120373.1 uncharacterized protein LOC123509856 [Portunus trituberculatus]
MWRLRRRLDYPALSVLLLLMMLMLMMIVPSGECLRCVNCTSLKDPECLDGIGIEEECASDQNYCVSYTGYLKKGQAQVLFRACTETNMSHFCGIHFEKLTNNRVERLIACYRTCTTDLCNVHKMEYLTTSSAPRYSTACVSPKHLLALFALLSVAVKKMLVSC